MCTYLIRHALTDQANIKLFYFKIVLMLVAEVALRSQPSVSHTKAHQVF